MVLDPKCVHSRFREGRAPRFGENLESPAFAMMDKALLEAIGCTVRQLRRLKQNGKPQELTWEDLVKCFSESLYLELDDTKRIQNRSNFTAHSIQLKHTLATLLDRTVIYVCCYLSIYAYTLAKSRARRLSNL